MTDCDGLDDLGAIACAISNLRPDWWEPWVTVAGLIASVLIPVLIAIWVSADARKTTLIAVRAQIDAEREERRRDELRARVTTVVGIADRQAFVERDRWPDEFLDISSAIAMLIMALPWNAREYLEDWFNGKAHELVEIRTAMLDGKDKDKDKLARWTANVRTIGEMILAEADLSTIRQIIEWMDRPESDAESVGT